MPQYRRPPSAAVLLAPVAAAAASALAAAPSAALAAPDEIEVYRGEHQAPGGFGLELHNNYVVEGDDRPDHPGAQPSGGAYRLTPELAYGLTPNLEMGVLALATVDSRGRPAVGGLKARVRFVQSPEGRSWWWGANFEVGRSGRRFEASPWTAELRAIYGFEAGRWSLALNPILEWEWRGDAPASLELAAKLAYRLRQGLALGLESYNDLGPVRSPGRLGEASQMLYAAADVDLGRMGLNLGLGRGLTSRSDGWVVKAVIDLPLR